MQISERLNRIVEPETLMMAKLGRELSSKGINLINLSLGEPDFQTPQHIIEAAKVAMDEGYTKYTPVLGFNELRAAVAQKLKEENKLDYKAENILIATGAKQVLANAILSTINPGDEAIVPTPYWVTYSDQIKLAEGKCVFIPCSVEEHFKITPEKLETAITPKTRLFIFSSPCNPSGAVYSKEELEGLAKVLAKHPDITVISDEIYEYINYVGKHESIAQFDYLKNQVILVNGFSKGFAMTGWRLGYMAAPIEMVNACGKLQGQITSGTNSIAQRAAITALTADKTPSLEMVKAFKERKEFFINALKNIPGIKINNPEGAFYAFPNVSYYFGKSYEGHKINTAADLAMYLLNVAHVSSVSGSAFGNNNCIRFSFAASMNNLQEAIQRIRKALSHLS